tara:strand:- start:242 stop:1981 length:1740 start_codon:yes stop_codon:yes gene_type:complete
MNKNISETEKFISMNNDEIDIALIFNFFNRNKLFISFCSVIFFVASAFYSLTLKRVWEGQFQIVVNSENKTNTVDTNLMNLFGVNQVEDLKTQVGILESPSILMPVFEIAKKKNSLLNKTKPLIFSKWKRKLEIGLSKDTSILNIAYRDTDKDLILPILEKMTSTYQDYSGKNKRRSQELTKKYLFEQIDLFKEKSSKSLKIMQEFATEQDLVFLNDDNPNDLLNSLSKEQYLIKSLSQLDNFLIPNIGIENIRVNAANQIRQIDSQIKKIQELGNDFKKLQYIGSTIPGLANEDIYINLADIEKNLIYLRTQYTDKDPKIIKTVQQRDLLVKLLRQRAIGYLEARKLKAKSKFEAAMRPKGVLLKYKELIRQAQRDESTLVSLERQLRVMELEQARLEDPWQLITEPTLLENPVAPSRRMISLLGLIFGLITGSLLAVYKENRSGKIFDKEAIENILLIPFLGFLNFEKKSLDIKELSFFTEFINKQIGKKICLISLNKTDYELIRKLEDYLIKNKKVKIEIDSICGLEDLNKCIISDIGILFASLNESKYADLNELKNKFRLLNLDLKGFFVLNNYE